MLDVEAIREINARHQDEIFRIPGVTAMGVGFLRDGSGAMTEEVGIVIHALEEAEGVAPVLPGRLEGARVEVRPGAFGGDANPVATPAELADEPRKQRVEPMIGGISVGTDTFHISPLQGTLGLAIVRNADGAAVILSNQHAICEPNPAVGDGVSQPLRSALSNLAASLEAWNTGNVNYHGTQYGMDAAIARPVNGRTAAVGQIFGLPNVSGSRLPRFGLAVIKSGVTTGITKGFISEVDAGVRQRGGDLILRNQVIILPTTISGYFAEGGDSGSAVVDPETNTVTALYWGGNGVTHEAAASPIDPILDYFQCNIP